MSCRVLACLLACLLAILPLATSQFTSPAAAAVLATGSKINVTYTTDLNNYTIALWQRGDNGSRPKLGSVVYATTDGPSSNFAWTVQTYSLDLAVSQTFFFWLFEGNTSHQGNDVHQVSSSYFRITDSSDSATTSLSAPESRSTSPAAASPSPVSLALSPLEPDLSVGARAGIGAAISVLCLVLMALLFLFCRRRRRLRERPHRQDEGLASAGGTASDCANSVAELQSECVSPPPMHKVPVYQPVPGDHGNRLSLAELPA